MKFEDLYEGKIINIEHGKSKAKIIKIYGKSKIEIETENNWNTICQFSQLENSTLKDKMRKRYHGVAYYGDGKYSQRSLAGARWHGILNKCYDTKSDRYDKRCSIDKEWLNFQNFAKWYEDNYIKLYHLDKDLKIAGNKKYGPDTCLFIPCDLGSSIKDSYRSFSDLPIGVNYNSNGNGIKYWVNNNYNNQKSGYFNSLDDAVKFYWDQKWKRFLELSIKHKKYKKEIIKYFNYLFENNCDDKFKDSSYPLTNYAYIGSPFFTKDQLDTVILIEKKLDENGIKYFSPRSEGILIDMTKEEREKKFKEIYESNIEHMKGASFMIANIDDKDIGTAFEIGFMSALKRPIFSFSNNDWQINIMLRQSVNTHNTNINNLIINLNQLLNEEELTVFDELTKDVT